MVGVGGRMIKKLFTIFPRLFFILFSVRTSRVVRWDANEKNKRKEIYSRNPIKSKFGWIKVEGERKKSLILITLKPSFTRRQGKNPLKISSLCFSRCCKKSQVLMWKLCKLFFFSLWKLFLLNTINFSHCTSFRSYFFRQAFTIF